MKDLLSGKLRSSSAKSMRRNSAMVDSRVFDTQVERVIEHFVAK